MAAIFFWVHTVTFYIILILIDVDNAPCIPV